MMWKSLILFISAIALPALMVSADDAPALPDGCVCAATDNLDPVCGNNGVTYPNLSILRCADKCVKYSIHFMHHGPCKT